MASEPKTKKWKEEFTEKWASTTGKILKPKPKEKYSHGRTFTEKKGANKDGKPN